MSREVLQMALAVLKGCLEHPDAQDSIIAIEHELAQPEQEPVGWQWLDTANFRKKIPPAGESECWNPVYKSPPQPIPQDVPQIPQEHSSNEVYRVTSKDGSTCHFGNYATAKAAARGGKVETVKLRDLRLVTEPCRTCVSLAQAVMSDQTSHDTSPPQRQPLTDDEIVNLRNEHRHWYAFARAIEAAHGIGDKT